MAFHFLHCEKFALILLELGFIYKTQGGKLLDQ